MKKIIRFICYRLYYDIAIWLPASYKCGWGVISGKIRYALCKKIFASCGKGVTIERGANFGKGYNLKIGDNSGIGVNAIIPDVSIIGKDVMMGPNCVIHERNHRFDRLDIPMRIQGSTESKPIVIEDDVWIGRDVTIMVGRHISKGSIIAANCVLTKDFPEYSIIGGNPGQVIRSRKIEAFIQES